MRWLEQNHVVAYETGRFLREVHETLNAEDDNGVLEDAFVQREKDFNAALMCGHSRANVYQFKSFSAER